MNIGASHVYLAGQLVPAGTYRQIKGSREIRIDREDVLPATCDGRVAAYVRLPEAWGERQDDPGQTRDDSGNPGTFH